MILTWSVVGVLWVLCGFAWGWRFGSSYARKRIARGLDAIDFENGVSMLITMDMVKALKDEMESDEPTETVN